jgi:hypothetical protein
MAITFNTAARNNGDLDIQFQFNDELTGDLIDFTGALIGVEIDGADCCQNVIATTDNGMITIISLGIFEMVVPYSTMRNFRPGSYDWGGAYQLNGETISLFEGSLSLQKGKPKL